MPRFLGYIALLIVGLSIGTAAGAAARPPRYPVVAVALFQIEPEPYPGAPARPDEAELLQRLAAEAMARAARTLLKQNLAGRAERLAEPRPPAPVPVLTGVVRLPTTLPAGQAGGRAMFRKGPFATATVAMRQPDGTVAQRAVTLDWRDIRWVRGARIRRARPVDDVLVDFVRKAVDHAVKQLKKPTDGQSPATAEVLVR